MSGWDWFNDNIVAIVDSLVASAISGVFFGVVWPMTRRRYDLHRFRKTFGAGISKAKDIAISVPLWQALPKINREPRFLKPKGYDHREALYGPNEMFNRQDMRAAAAVLNIFGNQFKDEIDYTNDGENKLNWSRHTVVVIGAPIANEHSAKLMSEIQRRIKAIHVSEEEKEILRSLPVFEEMVEDGESGARSYIRNFDPDYQSEYRATNSLTRKNKDAAEYGLVMRVPNLSAEPGKFFTFLLAGIHATGTAEAGLLLNGNWQKLGNLSLVEAKLELANKKPRPWLVKLLHYLWRNGAYLIGAGPKDVKVNGFVFEMEFEKAGDGKIVQWF